MKEIRETKMVEQVNVKFIADDGKEFVGDKAEYECRAYERTLKEADAKAELAKLNVKQVVMPFSEWCGEGEDLFFAHFENVNEYYLFTSCVKKIYDPYDDSTEEPKEFPCNVIYACNGNYFSDMSENTFNRYVSEMKTLLEMIKEEK